MVPGGRTRFLGNIANSATRWQNCQTSRKLWSIHGCLTKWFLCMGCAPIRVNKLSLAPITCTPHFWPFSYISSRHLITFIQVKSGSKTAKHEENMLSVRNPYWETILLRIHGSIFFVLSFSSGFAYLQILEKVTITTATFFIR